MSSQVKIGRVDIGLAPAVLICAALGVLAAQVLIPGTVPALGGGHVRSMSRVFQSPGVGAVGDYPQILARPLFTPTRNASDSGLGPAGAQLSDYTVAGTALAKGMATAIVRGPDGKVQSLRIGDTLLGARVTAIRHDGLTLDGAGGQRVVAVGAAAAPVAPR